MKWMKSLPAFFVLGASVCLMAQTPPPQPPKPQATQAEGVTTPIQLTPPEMTTVPKDKVIIQVNDIKITAGQLDQILEAYPENTRVYVRGPGRQQFIDQLVRTLVLSEEGKRRKLDEDPTYKVLAQYSLQAILANQTNENIKKNVQVDEPSLKKYYEDHRCEYEKWRARHVLIRFTGAPVPVRPGEKDLSEADALARAQDLRTRIQGGADFAEIAKAESDDINSGAKGGELGIFEHGQMVPVFEQAACKMKPGDLSEPVKSQFGYHLIQLEEKQAKTFEELKPELEVKVRPEVAKKQVEELVNRAKVILDPELLPSSKIPK
jgi:peptidyl-prolyl cis-trans isomerase C